MNRMSLRIVLRPGSARLAIVAIALVIGTTHSQPLRAQFGGNPSGSYGDPYGSYRGPYKQYRQYDPYDDDGGPSPSEDRGDMVPFKRSGVPLLAVVGLDTQRVSIYDSAGRLLQRSPVSTGQAGYETPAGIFSVVQKKADHNSNLYEDGNMPFMQRITWSGIALHGGVLPGHPASHGCVRMPYDFAQRLFGVTRLGMRVIVAPSDVAPAEIVHPALFPTQPGAGTIAAARAAEADDAARKADQARLAAVIVSREAARAMMRVAENLKLRAEAQLAAADRAVASAGSAETREQAEDAKTKAAARASDLEAQWAAAKPELQPKFDAAASAREAAVVAENARV